MIKLKLRKMENESMCCISGLKVNGYTGCSVKIHASHAVSGIEEDITTEEGEKLLKENLKTLKGVTNSYEVEGYVIIPLQKNSEAYKKLDNFFKNNDNIIKDKAILYFWGDKRNVKYRMYSYILHEEWDTLTKPDNILPKGKDIFVCLGEDRKFGLVHWYEILKYNDDYYRSYNWECCTRDDIEKRKNEVIKKNKKAKQVDTVLFLTEDEREDFVDDLCQQNDEQIEQLVEIYE